MKISIGSKFIEKPFGGGNEFVKNLISKLTEDGHVVLNNLKDPEIDIILLINPLIDSELSTFNNFDIDFYKTFINKKAISIHRINECDERKNTKKVNKAIINSNKNIDSNVYVSSWIKNLYITQGISKKPYLIAKGGPLGKKFNSVNKTSWNKKEKLKLVTHHWSANDMKGLDLYMLIDNLCSDSYWKEKIEFTYIGNLPKNIEFKNTKVINPLSSDDLAKELRNHNVYITGSKNEPSGNHHMEGALCGLPIIYINSGALPEYCSEYGVETNLNNIENSIHEIMNKYEIYFNKVKKYPYSFENLYIDLINHFEYLIDNKEIIYEKRSYQSKYLILFNFSINKLKRIIFNIYKNARVFLGKVKRFVGNYA